MSYRAINIPDIEKRTLVEADIGATFPQVRRQRSWKDYALAILAGSSIWLIHQAGYVSTAASYFAGDATTASKDLSHVCVQPGPAQEPVNYTKLYDYEGFDLESAERLAGAIRIPTQSFDFMGEPGEDDRWLPMIDMRKYLKKTFPVLHEVADLALVRTHSMVYTIKGTDDSVKPFMIMAHLDVVPAETALDRWTYPPFKGVVADGWIWGRGATDTKNNVIGSMTAIEYMLADGWRPKRTIILAYGMDEETGGQRGASTVGKYLEEIYGKGGIAMICDEGGMGVQDIYGAKFALPGLAEKGHSNFYVEVDTIGGHSSVPLMKYSSIGILSKIISAVEDDDMFYPDMQESSPVWGYMQCAAKYGKEDVPSWITDAVYAQKPNFKAIAEDYAEISLKNKYLVQTSKAITKIEGGIKINALPESAVGGFNSRIDFFSSVAETAATYSAIIESIARRYNFSFNGKSFTDGEVAGNITLTIDNPTEPIPSSPIDSNQFVTFAKAVQATFGPETIVAPSSSTGNTDTRHYVNLTKHIYRFSPVDASLRGTSHTVNEKITVTAHVKTIEFYTNILILADDMGGKLD